MNPADISNAMIYGIPIISCIGYGYESLMACRGRLLAIPTSQKDVGYGSALSSTSPSQSKRSTGRRGPIPRTDRGGARARRVVAMPGAGTVRSAAADERESTRPVSAGSHVHRRGSQGGRRHGDARHRRTAWIVGRADPRRRDERFARAAAAYPSSRGSPSTETADSKAVLASLLGTRALRGRSMHARPTSSSR